MEENSLELMELIDEFLRDSLEFSECEKLLCHICGEMWTEESLESHLKSHGDTFRGHKCLLCSSSCDMNLTWRDLVDFDFSADFEELFPKDGVQQQQQEVTQCEICGKILLKSSVGAHVRIKHCAEKPYECDACGRRYKSRGSLKLHRRNHVERSKCCICEKCGSSFFDAKSLRAHMRRLHAQQAKDFLCPACGKVFKTANDLKYHRNAVHLTTEKTFLCRICGLSFKGRQGLHRHVARHRDGEILHHKCSFCGVKFAEEASWRRHEENCSGQMNYGCKYCSERFSTYVRLRGHRRRAHQEKIRRRTSRKAKH